MDSFFFFSSSSSSSPSYPFFVSWYLPTPWQGRVDELDDSRDTDHFENIQSTNWQTVRWKPPPARPAAATPATGGAAADEGLLRKGIGWRTEFRPMEVQVTDFENAAFSVLVVLVTRVILAYDLCLYIPMSKARTTPV